MPSGDQATQAGSGAFKRRCTPSSSAIRTPVRPMIAHRPSSIAAMPRAPCPVSTRPSKAPESGAKTLSVPRSSTATMPGAVDATPTMRPSRVLRQSGASESPSCTSSSAPSVRTMLRPAVS